MLELKRHNLYLMHAVAFFIIIAIVSGGFMLIYATNPVTYFQTFFMSAMSAGMQDRLAPELKGIEYWFNTENSLPLTISGLRGKVVLVDFWTYSCVNCRRSIPHLVEWDEKYRDQGLVIIGVHTPEFRFERDLNNVAAEIADFGIQYPVAVDNEYQTWRAYHNLYWPSKYLIDSDGNIVYTRVGEGAYDVTEQKIVELLAAVEPGT